MQLRKLLKQTGHQTLRLSLILFLSGITALVHAQQSPSVAALGIAQYSRASYLQESTQKIELNKAPTWMTVGAYHTDDSISKVVKYFKEKAQESVLLNNSNPVLKSLLIENWKIEKSNISGTPTVFGLGDELRKSKAEVEIEKSFGIFVLADSIVRVHLISPHHAENNSELVKGTMILIIRERMPLQKEGTAGDSGIKSIEFEM